MKKLTLKLDDLKVDTFTAAEQPDGRGTVAGHYGTTHTQHGQTCGPSCGDTCDYTCAGYATSPGPEYHCILCGG
ncbi:MAG TPA: hypothetical protein VFX98_06595 [Longimicrobiaceae bacterium]|nr:hypothetical protein [Longimicrobiaceae bacterium]